MKKIISIYGPPSVGKTTIAKAIVNQLGKDICTRIALDKYLKNRNPEIDRITFLNTDPVDWQLVEQHILSPKGTLVKRPKYDLDNYVRVGVDETDATIIQDIIFIEGAWPYLKADIKVQLELDSHTRLKRMTLRYFNEWNKTGEVFVKLAAENWEKLPGYYPDVQADFTINTADNLATSVSKILKLLNN